MVNEATPSRSKGKCSRCENQFDFSFSDDKKHEATTTTTVEQELIVSKLLQRSRVNRSPLSFVANLPYTSKISAAFQGCSSQGCVVNIFQQKPNFNPEEQLRYVDVNYFINC